jgi:hypothetical protein
MSAERIAELFSEKLRAVATDEEWAEMRAANRAEECAQVCHSHDFCDANVTMDEAFEEVTGRSALSFESDSDEEAGAFALWNEAWEIAKRKYLQD